MICAQSRMAISTDFDSSASNYGHIQVMHKNRDKKLKMTVQICTALLRLCTTHWLTLSLQPETLFIK